MGAWSARAAAALLLAAVIPTNQASAATASCNRSCLEGLVNQYLAALPTHDASRLPVAKTVRFTENTNAMKLGDGLWRTAGALEPDRFFISDPQAGQVAFYGRIKENGQTALLALRMKVVDRKFTEIEQMVVRKSSNSPGDFDKMIPVSATWGQTVPVANRRPRAELIRLANLYFEGIEKGNGDIVPFDDTGIRIENGFQTAPSRATPDRPAMNVREQFNSKIFNYITEVQHRRFLVVDEERGVVFGTFMFKHPGDILEANSPRFGKVKITSALAQYPNTTQIIEAFKIDGGRIKEIYAYVSLLPYEQKPGWPDAPAKK